MSGAVKLLILAGKRPPRGRKRRLTPDRTKVLTALAAAGVKVRHDSGGRLLVVELTEEAEKALAERVREARLVSLDADVKAELAPLTPTETLFLDALRIRTSKAYRESKAKRKYGETPEEQLLTMGPCIRRY